MPALLPAAIASAAPAPATAPPLTRLGAACARGWATSPAVTPAASTAGLGWNSLAVPATGGQALARLRLGRCPRREDRRGSSRRSAALFRPAGFGWGRARECGTRQLAASPTPPPIRARAIALAYARRSNPPRRRISNAACPSAPFQTIFRAHFGALGAKNAPRAFISPKKWPQKALQGRLQLAPSVSLRVKLGATCLTAAYLPGADSGPRPAPSRPRKARSVLGSCLSALRGKVSQSSRNN